MLARQGYAGRQVVLAQNSRDFVFVRRYRYMFALKSHQLGATKKKRVGLEKRLGDDPEDDDTIKTRFQEIGPRLTVKMRWIRRGALGETGDERERREKAEEVARGQTRQPGESLSLGAPELMAEFGTVQEGEDPDKGEVGGHSKVKGKGRGGDLGDGEHEDDDEADEERQAAQDIGLDADDDSSQPNFDFNGVAAAAEAEAAVLASRSSGPTRASEDDDPATTSRPTKRPRTTPRKRTKPAHPLLRPARSPTPPPGVSAMGEPEAVPLPPRNGKKKLSGADASVLSTVGKTWHAGKGQGGVRDGKDRREWNWEVSPDATAVDQECFLWFLFLFFFLGDADLTNFYDHDAPLCSLFPLSLSRPKCKSAGASSSCDFSASEATIRSNIVSQYAIVTVTIVVCVQPLFGYVLVAICSIYVRTFLFCHAFTLLSSTVTELYNRSRKQRVLQIERPFSTWQSQLSNVQS